jgi:hypothetical protein
MNTKTYTIHTMPTMPAMRVTGAALRSVEAADAAGRAAHQAIIDAQTAMVAHHKAIPADGIDATWAAESIRLIARQHDAIEAQSAIATRWGAWRASVLYVTPTQPMGLDWEWRRKHYAADLRRAGVPAVTSTDDAAAWDDAAARGC